MSSDNASSAEKTKPAVQLKAKGAKKSVVQPKDVDKEFWKKLRKVVREEVTQVINDLLEKSTNSSSDGARGRSRCQHGCVECAVNRQW